VWLTPDSKTSFCGHRQLTNPGARNLGGILNLTARKPGWFIGATHRKANARAGGTRRLALLREKSKHGGYPDSGLSRDAALPPSAGRPLLQLGQPELAYTMRATVCIGDLLPLRQSLP
jgi:hypothetical protein